MPSTDRSGSERVGLRLIVLGALGGLTLGLVWLDRRGDVQTWPVLGAVDLALFAVAGLVGGLLARWLASRLRLARIPGLARVLSVLVVAGALSAAVAAVWMVRGMEPAPGTRAANVAAGAPRAPDVLVVIYDAVRADALADEDGRVPAWAPHLRQLSEEGIVFRSAVAPAPWTVPTHVSLFTGLSPLVHGAVEEAPVVREELHTLAELLRQQGYYTVALSANPWLSVDRGFAQGFVEYHQLWTTRARAPLAYRITRPFERRGWITTEDPQVDKGARLASRLTRDLLGRLDPEVPVFLFVNLTEAHRPYGAPGKDKLRFVPPELLGDGIPPDEISQDWMEIIAGEVSLGPREWRILQGLNRGAVAYMDRHLGRMLDAFERSGRLEDAFVAVTSDHGAGLGEDQHLGSGFDLQEHMLRIPLIVRLPDGRAAGTVREDLVYLQDLFPTVLELAAGGNPGATGSELPAHGSQANSVSLFVPEARQAGISAFSRPVKSLQKLAAEHPRFDASFLDRRLLALRGTRWKLVWSSTGEPQLYDLLGGGERRDLAEVYPDLTEEQLRQLRELLGNEPSEAWEGALAGAGGGEGVAIDGATREMLRALGYSAE